MMKNFEPVLLLASFCLGCGVARGSEPSDKPPEVVYPVIVSICPINDSMEAKVCRSGQKLGVAVAPGKKLQLQAIMYPTGHADDLGVRLHGSAVTWRSLDESIATVDSDGLVTGVRTGEVRISIKCNICPMLPDGYGWGFGIAMHLGPPHPRP